jgi:RimJ/RimL family protein N-acetyltransferase
MSERTSRAPAARRRAPVLPAPWLQTLRLDLREFVAADQPDLVRLDTDPRVMRYIGNGSASRPAEVAAMLRRILRYPRLYPDLGLWRATRRDSGAFVGWFSLKYAGKSADIEVGYRLLRDAWGFGFATEGAQALVDYGFDDLDLDRIIGVTHKDNVASQRVLLKCGLADCGWGRYYDQRLRLFAATNPHRAD